MSNCYIVIQPIDNHLHHQHCIHKDYTFICQCKANFQVKIIELRTQRYIDEIYDEAYSNILKVFLSELDGCNLLEITEQWHFNKITNAIPLTVETTFLKQIYSKQLYLKYSNIL